MAVDLDGRTFTPNTSIPDYPTAWAIQARGVEHLDPRCSAVHPMGPMLCDCGAVVAAWELMHERPDFEEWLTTAAPAPRAHEEK